MNERNETARRSHAHGAREHGRGALVVVLALLAGLGAGWILFGGALRAPSAARDGATSAETLYTCSMHPQVLQREPGLCPLCQMQLVPRANASSAPGAGAAGAPAVRRVRYWIDASVEPPFVANAAGRSPQGNELVPVHSEELAAGDVLTIDPRMVQNMGLRTSAVERGSLMRTLRLPGIAVEPEPNRRDISLRVGGWIQTLHADTDGVHVLQGAPLFDLYSPELSIAIEELIAARRANAGASPGSSAQELLRVSRERLVALGLLAQDLAAFEALERAPAVVTFKSPIQGHVVRKSVVAGARVEAGASVLELSDNATMWIDFQLSAAQLPLLQIGERVRIEVGALPGRSFESTLSFLHPHFDMQTRTALARTQLQNPDWKLREGMLATGEISVEAAHDALIVPREAVLDTGTRQIAFVVLPDGSFEPTRVRLGASGDDGRVQVLEGLAPGERVVTSGQFLLDSETRVREGVKRFLAGGSGTEERVLGRLEEPEAEAAAVDAVLAPYLQLAESLGADRPPARPFDALTLVTASQQLVERARGATRARAETLRAKAFELVRADVEGQRKLFAPLSDALVAIVRRAPQSEALAPKLFVLHCPMAPGSWLSRSETIANPFYADSMKRCGEVVATIEARRAGGSR